MSPEGRPEGEPGPQRAEASVDATFDRVARALAAAEPCDRGHWAGRFREVLDDFRFLPGGRILAGAGTARRVTLFNCFVMGTVEDSLDGIFAALRESALTMQQGGGIGIDFSTLRPRAAPADATGGIASGPVSFMELWNQSRGAMMGTLSCEHPDVADFIDAKRRAGRLTHFNLSVLVSDAFMRAVEVDADWTLAFARAGVERRVGARALWDAIVASAYESAEPGVLFIDRIRAEDNLAYAETISATNPCGEIPLPPYGACDLGSINLTRFVRAPFTAEAALDRDALAATAGVATRMLDNVYEVSRFPLPQQEAAARGSRRLGLGITGLADALAMLGLDYGAPAARGAAAEAMRTICEAAYVASIELARERGSFARYDRERYLAAPFVARLPAHVRDAAPAGTISLLAGNVSSGLEPVFALEYARDIRQQDGATAHVAVEAYAVARFRALRGSEALPGTFVTAREVPAAAQLAMQAALQPHVDNAISKTTNVAADIPREEFGRIYRRAWELGLKGCTVFRPNAVTGAVLTGPEPRCERCDAPAVAS